MAFTGASVFLAMSERGSFVTEYIYCPRCLEAARGVLCGEVDKFWAATQLPGLHRITPLPIIAGRIGGSWPGEELSIFQEEIVPALSAVICHDMRIVVLAENGDEVFRVSPGVSR